MLARGLTRREGIAEAGQIVGEADVWIGERDRVPLTPAEDVVATAPWGGVKDMKTSIRYNGPIAAPIELGQEIAELVIEAPGLPPVSVPLVAAASVDEGGVLTRAGAAFSLLVSDILGDGEEEEAAPAE